MAALLVLLPQLSGQSGQPLQIITDVLPNDSVGVFYSQPIAVVGGTCTGTGTPSSTIDAGQLPPGITIVSPPGVEQWSVQGTPTAAGTFQFTLHVFWTHTRTTPFDPSCTDDAVKALSLTVVSGSGGGGGGGGGGGSGGGGGPNSAPLSVDRPQVTTTYHTGHFPPLPETVKVTAQANGSIPFTAKAATSSGGSWLSVTPTIGVTPVLLGLSFSIDGLVPGVYSGTVTIQAGGNQAVVVVTLTVVTDATLVLQATPPSLAFSYVIGGPTPPGQSLSVTAAGDPVIFQTNVTLMNAPANAMWLQITPSGAATPANLTVSVNPKNLTPGMYTGVIALGVPGVSTSAQTIPVTFSVRAAPAMPAITTNGVVSAASLTGAISPGAWVSIFGSNLAATTRSWATADFVGGVLPVSLDGVSVTIDGKPAAVSFISPTQINALAPDDPATGLVSVQVTSQAGSGNTALVLEQTAAPAFFQFRANTTLYVAGTHADGSYLAGAGLVQLGIAGTPAKPGETIVIYGTGFGATQPPISATALVTSPLPLANPQDLHVRIGGLDCAIAFAGLVSPGLYQFNVVVPQVADGDQPIVAELRGLLTQANLLLTVQH